jgi:DNA-binding HxlR family transcriptional regulator
MAQGGYGQFCPVAMAAEVICSRWTLLILRELGAGASRFNELRRGMPRMSPALLSQRLKELEAAGVVQRLAGPAGAAEYRLTDAGRDAVPIVEAVGAWGHRWMDPELSMQQLDATLLMWDMRRNLDPRPMPERRCVIHFQFPDAPAGQRAYWLVVCPRDGVDLCSVDPGHDVDLYATSDLRTMTGIWMGYDTVRVAVAAGRLKLIGDRQLASSMQTWLGLSPFARQQKLAS